MLLTDYIYVDELPKNCKECTFNQNKYCAAKMCLPEKEQGNTFVQNNTSMRDSKCPLFSDSSLQN